MYNTVLKNLFGHRERQKVEIEQLLTKTISPGAFDSITQSSLTRCLEFIQLSWRTYVITEQTRLCDTIKSSRTAAESISR